MFFFFVVVSVYYVYSIAYIVLELVSLGFEASEKG